MKNVIRIVAAALGIIHGTIGDADAAIVKWNAGTGDWSTASNWDPQTVPDGSKTAEIDSGHPLIFKAANSDDVWLGESNSTTNTASLDIFRNLGQAPGVLVSFGDVYVGFHSAGTSTATVDGANGGGVIWQIDEHLHVGSQSSGPSTLNIKNGGKVEQVGDFGPESSVIGYVVSANGTANVDGNGSLWETGAGILMVGAYGTGTLNITNGGRVSSRSGIIAQYGPYNCGVFCNSVGNATVSGSGSTWENDSEVYVGESGTGTLTIQNGGVVTSIASHIGYYPGSKGTVSVSGTGSKWTMTGSLNIGDDGEGSLSVSSGGVVTAPSGVTITPTGSLTGSGTIVANVSNSGKVHPSNPFAALTINGNYTQTTSGALNPDLDGDGVGKLVVNGAITLAGSLNVTNLDFPFWEPEIGQSFDLLDWVGGPSGISGTFASINLPAVHGAKMWNKTRLYTTGVISVSSPGDFNDDARVDASDYVFWRRSGGSAADYNKWRANFGLGVPGSGSATFNSLMGTNVPEPSNSVPLIVAATLLTCRRRVMR